MSWPFSVTPFLPSVSVTKVAVFIGANVGGAIGWWLGARVGVMTGFFVCVLGTAAGGYLARRWVADYLP